MATILRCDFCGSEAERSLPKGWGQIYVSSGSDDDDELKHVCAECLHLLGVALSDDKEFREWKDELRERLDRIEALAK